MSKREINKFYNFLYAYFDVVKIMDVAECRIGPDQIIRFKKNTIAEKRVSYLKKIC